MPVRGIFLFVGFSENFATAHESCLKRKAGDHGLVRFTPIDARDVSSVKSRLERAVNHLADSAAARHQTDWSEAGLVVIYLRQSSTIGSLVQETFFPYALVLECAPELPGQTPNERAAADNRLRDRALDLIDTAKTALAAISKEVTEKRNKTPVLLPLRNFRSDHLRPLLDKISGHARVDSGRLTSSIANAVNRFEAQHPRRTATAGNRLRSFEDERGVRFNAPGPGGNHGLPSLDFEHPACFLAALWRLGARYTHGFHYDCIPAEPRALKLAFSECHGTNEQQRTINAENHVNIYPNDYLR